MVSIPRSLLPAKGARPASPATWPPALSVCDGCSCPRKLLPSAPCSRGASLLWTAGHAKGRPCSGSAAEGPAVPPSGPCPTVSPSCSCCSRCCCCCCCCKYARSFSCCCCSCSCISIRSCCTCSGVRSVARLVLMAENSSRPSSSSCAQAAHTHTRTRTKLGASCLRGLRFPVLCNAVHRDLISLYASAGCLIVHGLVKSTHSCLVKEMSS